MEPGSQVGSYRIIEALGSGGMGVVYLAEHTVLRRRVALKTLKPGHEQGEAAIGRFVMEAQVVNRIRHEHIVDITDIGEAPGGQVYLVMELLEGESLGQRLHREGPLSLVATLEIGVQLADALGASHLAGVLHRDVKPGNVFLIERRGSRHFVKLLDFGLAKLLDLEAAHLALTATGEIPGTPLYMSPEQCLGRKIDHRADLYSLGVVLYQMLTGQLPRVAETFVDLLTLYRKPAPRVTELRPEIPPALAELVHLLLTADVAERPESAASVRSTLARLLAGLPDAASSPFLATPDDPGAPRR